MAIFAAVQVLAQMLVLCIEGWCARMCVCVGGGGGRGVVTWLVCHDNRNVL